MPGYNNPMGNSPLEVKVISKRFGLPNSTSLDVFVQHEGYQALKKALGMKPEGHHQRSEELWPTGARRRGL